MTARYWLFQQVRGAPHSVLKTGMGKLIVGSNPTPSAPTRSRTAADLLQHRPAAVIRRSRRMPLDLTVLRLVGIESYGGLMEWRFRLHAVPTEARVDHATAAPEWIVAFRWKGCATLGRRLGWAAVSRGPGSGFAGGRFRRRRDGRRGSPVCTAAETDNRSRCSR
jgi:hypothetical protein